MTCLLQPNCPGWMYQVERGAAATWEQWDALRPDGTVNETSTSGGDDNMVPFNHYAFGSVGKLYYRYILGIQPMEPGFARVRIQPFADGRLGTVSGSYRSRNGEIRMAWDAESKKVSITTPVTAELILPNREAEIIAPGFYSFLIDIIAQEIQESMSSHERP